jgi:GTP-binding protein HflX
LSKTEDYSGSNKSNPRHRWDSESENAAERAVVLVPEFRNNNSRPPTTSQYSESEIPEKPVLARSLQSRIGEAVGLARAIDLDVVTAIDVPVRSRRPATLFGKGKVEEIAQLITSVEAGLAIIDYAISPVQQQNLENAWNCKVLDRTGLILEIFGERAQTREGRAQVELAHLNYQRGRLVRSWTHLERQRGGLGFVGGPGETQIEADRRMISERINRLEKQLEKIQRTRSLHRSKRQKIPYPVIALVGYTNAGKSTLFNKVTGAEVYAKDQLFATLDPTLRQLELPEGTKVILSDTVGFVSNLPTHLVAAFRATLEEVIEADLIVHVRDISDHDTHVQSRDVYQIMEQLGVNCDDEARILEAWNKIDLLDPEQRGSISRLRTGQGRDREPVLISSVTGHGVGDLLGEIERRISGVQSVIQITLDISSFGKLNWVYGNTHVLERKDNEDGSVQLKLRVNPNLLTEVRALDKG